MNKDSSAADYLADCQNKQLTNVSFLQRTDLINWLSGNTESSQYLKAPGQKGETSDKVDIENKTLAGELSTVKSTTSASHENDSEVSDPVVVETMKHERILVDHNSALRGAKPINFGYLIEKMQKRKLVQSIKGFYEDLNCLPVIRARTVVFPKQMVHQVALAKIQLF